MHRTEGSPQRRRQRPADAQYFLVELQRLLVRVRRIDRGEHAGAAVGVRAP